MTFVCTTCRSIKGPNTFTAPQPLSEIDDVGDVLYVGSAWYGCSMRRSGSHIVDLYMDDRAANYRSGQPTSVVFGAEAGGKIPSRGVKRMKVNYALAVLALGVCLVVSACSSGVTVTVPVPVASPALSSSASAAAASGGGRWRLAAVQPAGDHVLDSCGR